jgi:hypothetical protein
MGLGRCLDTQSARQQPSFFPGQAGDMRRFQSELDEKVNGDVDMTTILWIWDRYTTLTPAGGEYQRFRRVMLDEVEQVGPNDNPRNMDVP